MQKIWFVQIMEHLIETNVNRKNDIYILGAGNQYDQFTVKTEFIEML